MRNLLKVRGGARNYARRSQLKFNRATFVTHCRPTNDHRDRTGSISQFLPDRVLDLQIRPILWKL